MQDLIDQLDAAPGAIVRERQPNDRVENFVIVMKQPFDLVHVDQYFTDSIAQQAYPTADTENGLAICYYGALACLARHHLQASEQRTLTMLLNRVRDSALGVPRPSAQSAVPPRLRNLIEGLQANF
jgi:hypothetical protein